MNKGERYYAMNRNGMSFRQIAKAEGPNVSVNSVAGAILRYRRSNNIPALNSSANKKPQPTDSKPKNENVAPVKSFMDVLTYDTCRFIEGDVKKGTDTYCGNPKMDGSSYCEKHHTLCHREDTYKKKKMTISASWAGQKQRWS